MKTRTRKPPAIKARGRVNQYEIDRLRYIKYHRPIYGMMVLTICQIPRHRAGSWYRATIAFQCCALLACSCSEFSSVVLDVSMLIVLVVGSRTAEANTGH